MSGEKVKTKFDPVETVVNPVGARVTKQEEAARTDIHYLLAQSIRGLPVPMSSKAAQYGDFSAFDHQGMLNAVHDLKERFMRLPAKIRARFSNDPVQLSRFIENPDNLEEAKKLGLIRMPETAKELTPLEREIERKRIERDASAALDAEVKKMILKFSPKQVKLLASAAALQLARAELHDSVLAAADWRTILERLRTS